MNILVTGSTGFIGNRFIKNAKDYSIMEVDLRTTTPDTIDFTGVDTVLHLAALVHQLKNSPDEEYYKINRDLAYNIAKKAAEKGTKHFVFMSTVKVYGETTDKIGKWDENSICEPQDAYAKSKLEAEKLILNLQSNTFKVAIVRIPLVYGEGVKANMLNLIKLIDSFPILPFGGINNKRSMIYIGNLIAFLNCIITHRASGIFIANDEKAISTTELITIIAKKLNKKITLIKVPRFLIPIFLYLKPKLVKRLYQSLVVDNDATLKKLNFNMPYSTEFGINAMVQWYKQIKSNIK